MAVKTDSSERLDQESMYTFKMLCWRDYSELLGLQEQQTIQF